MFLALSTMKYKQVAISDFNEWVSMGVALWPHYNKNSLAKVFHDILSSKSETSYICRNSEDVPVGFVNISLRNDYVAGATSKPVGYLEGIYVKPKYRKQGVAKELTKIAEKWSFEMGSQDFASNAEINNVNSQNFHKKIGFKEANITVNYIKKLTSSKHSA